MKWLRTLSLAATFFLDVHVRAELADPKDCFQLKGPCTVQAEGRRVIRTPELMVAMASDSLLEKRDAKTVQLVSGQFYVETKSDIRFQTPYGKIWCVDECVSILSRGRALFEMRSLGGNWRVQRTGEAQIYALPAGLELKLGEVTDDGRAQMDFPQSLPWIPTLKLWTSLFPGTLEEFKPTLVKFRASWRGAVELASDMHLEAASRSIASANHAARAAAARRKAIADEDQRLRDLFRLKNP